MAAREWKMENFDRVLVVEGHSDKYFYAEVLEEVGKHGHVYIKEIDGKTDLTNKLETLVTPSLLTKAALGFIMDADDAPEQTRQSLQQLLSRLTQQNVVDGKWTGGTPNIGLFVVPGGSAHGEIETLVWQSWANDPANASQKQCVQDYVKCMSSAGIRAHSQDKGLIGALLALRSDEDPRLGPGARDNVFDLGRPELEPLRAFLSSF